ncbi:hypothetical protein Hdeb2414_s0016g00489561 [Helianthus debilis subsp. tardiflorus]
MVDFLLHLRSSTFHCHQIQYGCFCELYMGIHFSIGKLLGRLIRSFDLHNKFSFSVRW